MERRHLAHIAAALAGGGWTPLLLGASLLAWWDAEQSNMSAGAVSSWQDRLNARDLTQGTGASQPTYSATSFNGRPGVTFDGTDDTLAQTGATWLPTGSTGSETWLVLNSTSSVSEGVTRNALSWGSNSGSNGRRCSVFGSGSILSARSSVGDGASNFTSSGTTDASGRHVLRYVVTPTQTYVEVDGVASTPQAVVPGTVASPRIRMAADPNGAAAAFYQGIVNACLIMTGNLTADQAAPLYAYLNARLA